jgi:hypothetical protein
MLDTLTRSLEVRRWSASTGATPTSDASSPGPLHFIVAPRMSYSKLLHDARKRAVFADAAVSSFH